MKSKDLLYAKKYGDKIKTLRQSLNLTQDDFAKKIGTRQGNVFRWESGEALISTFFIEKIFQEFGVRIACWDEKPDTSSNNMQPVTKEEFNTTMLQLMNRIRLLEMRNGCNPNENHFITQNGNNTIGKINN